MLRIATIVSFVAVALLFVFNLRLQNDHYNPELVRKRLQASETLVELNPWDVVFFRCADSRAISESDCAPTGQRLEHVVFPARDAIASTVAQAAQGLSEGERLVARITHTLSERERQWLGERLNAVLLFPRSVQKKVTFPGREAFTTGFGRGQNVEIPIQMEDVSGGGRIHVYFDLSGYPWFGPVSFPAALVEPNAAFDYGSLTVRQDAAGSLLKQLMVGFPLLLASMAFIIDHSASFLLLSFYGVAGAVRSFIPVVVNQLGSFPPWLELAYLAACGLSAVLLVQFVIAFATRWRISWRVRAGMIVPAVLAPAAVRFLTPSFYMSADLWCDALGALAALSILLVAAALHLRARFRPSVVESSEGPDAAAEKARSLFELRDALVWGRNGVLFLGLSLSAWANISDLARHLDMASKGFLDWKHGVLLPILIAASLVEVGSVSRKIKAVSKEVEQKARLDEELSIAREYQRKNLPPMRATGEGWYWRAWFRPASLLGGDWFDFREVTFSDGKRLLVVGIADITGHGVAAALFTTIVSSVWSLWCDEVARGSAPGDASARERLLASLPLRLHDALLSCRKEGSGTAAFCFIDAEAREMTFLTAGHPALVAATPTGVESLRTMNPALGHGDRETEVSWNAASRFLKDDEILVLYTDGLLPPGLNTNGWMGQLRRGVRNEGFSTPLAFLKRLRETRRVYRVRKSEEDDVTILMLGLRTRAERQATG